MKTLNKTMPIDLLITLLDNQDWVGVSSGNWEDIEYMVEDTDEGQNLNISSEKITFYFDKDGRFLGISNYKM